MLDSGSWRATLADTAAGHRLTMTSPPDPRTGLQVTRAFDIPPRGRGSGRASSSATSAPIRCGGRCGRCVRSPPWGSPARGAARGRGPDEAPVRMIEAVGEIDTGRYRGGAWEIPVQDVVGKLGFTAAERFVALDRGTGPGSD
ncbi:hypothetical protein G7085_09130 [Tessaracoccus sp. HDW20]|uniref:hypothetical protein n=1 Tax=Tessaracoccus coleopterorum TaxID=2714950 RepID=UPI0018D3A567|nr:hypothetical protein [Tessaracoccus coleopterorum]NHB84721.1 hypothetical protein [Tessaracoccus coleopterorum]